MIDTTAGGAPANAAAAAADAAAGGAAGADAAGGVTLGARVRAGMFANPATTVPQGTLIPAVLETAFNSNRPGFARAIVSRDVRGFDGTRVLIPRGSRLIGQYRADAQPGQKRAVVSWVRLVRPDGVTIAIGSPASDTLGRGGVKAKVNNHFFQRFAGALLQSAVDVGVALASRGSSSSVIVAAPGSSAQLGNLVPPDQIRPTLTVPAATSISVFVARDLDFTGIGRR
ncbi:TrbI/VirB10 family protein [Sphingosinicella sp. BN140058]|nr:TrbI/VirB10 family protein [Sphingosinicella sp. BN140058]